MAFIPDGIGWLATGVFAVSYFVRSQEKLRLTQALGAVLWIAYGVVIHSMPVIGANVIVSGLAVFSAARRRGARPDAANRAEADSSA